MSVVSRKSKKQQTSLEELKNIVGQTKFSESILNVKSGIYNNLVKNVVKNIDYIILTGVTFYLTKLNIFKLFLKLK